MGKRIEYKDGKPGETKEINLVRKAS